MAAWAVLGLSELYAYLSVPFHVDLGAVALEAVVLGAIATVQFLSPWKQLSTPVLPASIVLIMPWMWRLSANATSNIDGWLWLGVGWLCVAAVSYLLCERVKGMGIAVFMAMLAIPNQQWVVRRSAVSYTDIQMPALYHLTDRLPGSVATGENTVGPPILLITVDTLRWDRAEAMASVQALASRGSYWKRASSTSSWTVPALSSLQTGLDARVHGATWDLTEGASAIPAEAPTLAEAFSAAGYSTAAWNVNPFVGQVFGLTRGFHRWRDPITTPSVPLILAGTPGLMRFDERPQVDSFNQWLSDAPDGGWFAWLHLFGPHLPYLQLPEGSPLTPFDDVEALREAEGARREAVIAAYDYEVDYTDQQVMRVLAALEEQGFWARGGIVVFTSDHGEELWDHGGYEHGHSHHTEVVDVPLVVVGPGMTPGEIRQDPASLIDVAPTLLAMADLPGIEGVDGRDLRASEDLRTLRAHGTLYGPVQSSVLTSSHRAIVLSEEGTHSVRAYDHRTDPLETQALNDLSGLELIREACRDAEQGLSKTGESEAVAVAALIAVGYLSDEGAELDLELKADTQTGAIDCAKVMEP